MSNLISDSGKKTIIERTNSKDNLQLNNTSYNITFDDNSSNIIDSVLAFNNIIKENNKKYEQELLMQQEKNSGRKEDFIMDNTIETINTVNVIEDNNNQNIRNEEIPEYIRLSGVLEGLESYEDTLCKFDNNTNICFIGDIGNDNKIDRDKIYGIRRKIDIKSFNILLQLINNVTVLNKSIEINNNGACYFVSSDKTCYVKISCNLPKFCNFRFDNIDKIYGKLKYFSKGDSVYIDEYFMNREDLEVRKNTYKCMNSNISLHIDKKIKEKLISDNEENKMEYWGLNDRIFNNLLRQCLNCPILSKFSFNEERTKEIVEMFAIDNSSSSRLLRKNNELIIQRGTLDTGLITFYCNDHKDDNVNNKEVEENKKLLEQFKDMNIDSTIDNSWFKYNYKKFDLSFYINKNRNPMDFFTYIKGTINSKNINDDENENKDLFSIELIGKSYIESGFSILDV